MELTDEIVTERQLIILRSAGGEMTAKAFCDEHIRRGWAYPDLTPEGIGLDDTDIVRVTNPLQNVH